jgi:hypothetical protein
MLHVQPLDDEPSAPAAPVAKAGAQAGAATLVHHHLLW